MNILGVIAWLPISLKSNFEYPLTNNSILRKTIGNMSIWSKIVTLEFIPKGEEEFHWAFQACVKASLHSVNLVWHFQPFDSYSALCKLRGSVVLQALESPRWLPWWSRCYRMTSNQRNLVNQLLKYLFREPTWRSKVCRADCQWENHHKNNQ